MKRQRVAMYQRYGGGNIDEGWTRLVLEQFNFPLQLDLRSRNQGGESERKVRCADRSPATARDHHRRSAALAARRRGGRGGGARRARRCEAVAVDAAATLRPNTAPASALRESTPSATSCKRAGRWSRSMAPRLSRWIASVSAFATFWPARSTKEFWCPGSTLKVTFDNTNPLAYGMPSQGLALYLGSPAFEITAPSAENYEIGGPLRGSRAARKRLAGGRRESDRRAAVVSAKMGQGTSGADRIPRATPRPDPRHLQAAVQRAGRLMDRHFATEPRQLWRGVIAGINSTFHTHSYGRGSDANRALEI